MKSNILKFYGLCALSSVALHAENLVVNGDFESGEGNAFYATPPWYNRGTGFNQGTNARSDQGAVIAGSFSATVNDRYDSETGKFGPVVHVQKTKHMIEAGDSFTLSYEWRPADTYWQRSADTVRFVLYATANDNAGGEVVWSAELTSEFFTRKLESTLPVSETTEVVNAEAVGHSLFVMFYGLDTKDNGSGVAHWARVDNIEVEVLKK